MPINGKVSNIFVDGNHSDQDLILSLSDYISIVGEIDILQDILGGNAVKQIFGQISNPEISAQLSTTVSIDGKIENFLILTGAVNRTIPLVGSIPITSILGRSEILIKISGQIDTKSEEVIGYWLLDFSDSINSFYIVVI